MIKILGSYQRKVTNESKNYEVTFEVADYQSKKAIEELQKQPYTLEIKKPRSKRSLNQNAYLWAIICQLARVMHDEEMNIYCNLLDLSNAKTEILKATAKAERTLQKSFRVVKLLKYDEVNKDYAYFKCYYGSSTYNTKEMTQLIDTALSWCSELDIEMESYDDKINYSRY